MACIDTRGVIRLHKSLALNYELLRRWLYIPPKDLTFERSISKDTPPPLSATRILEMRDSFKTFVLGLMVGFLVLECAIITITAPVSNGKTLVNFIWLIDLIVLCIYSGFIFRGYTRRLDGLAEDYDLIAELVRKNLLELSYEEIKQTAGNQIDLMARSIARMQGGFDRVSSPLIIETARRKLKEYHKACGRFGLISCSIAAIYAAAR